MVGFTSDAPVCDGTAISFTDQTVGGDIPYTYGWDFGDGGLSSSANPNHLYAGPGSYTVKLTVTDAGGATGTATDTVVVRANTTASASNGGPYCLGETIEFFASGGTSYSWTGPDGFASSEQNPTIATASANDAGIYTVIVTNIYGCTDQASTLVAIDAASPVLSLPTDITVECGESTDPARTGQASAVDDTDPAPVVTYSDTPSLDQCGGTTGQILRLWTVYKLANAFRAMLKSF